MGLNYAESNANFHPICPLAKGAVLLLGLTEPTMDKIKIDRSTTLKISKH